MKVVIETMPRIYLNNDDADYLRGEFTQTSQEMKQLVDELQTFVSDAASYWTADSYDAFQQAFSSLRPEMERFYELCDEFQRAVNEVRMKFADGDSEIAGYFIY